MRLDVGARGGIHIGTAAGGKNLRAPFEQAGDDLALALAEIGLAMLGKDLADDCPAAISISVSASMKGSSSRFASRRPTAVLPAPISPISTMLRCPSASRIPAKRSFQSSVLMLGQPETHPFVDAKCRAGSSHRPRAPLDSKGCRNFPCWSRPVELSMI